MQNDTLEPTTVADRHVEDMFGNDDWPSIRAALRVHFSDAWTEQQQQESETTHLEHQPRLCLCSALQSTRCPLHTPSKTLSACGSTMLAKFGSGQPCSNLGCALLITLSAHLALRETGCTKNLPELRPLFHDRSERLQEYGRDTTRVRAMVKVVASQESACELALAACISSAREQMSPLHAHRPSTSCPLTTSPRRSPTSLRCWDTRASTVTHSGTTSWLPCRFVEERSEGLMLDEQYQDRQMQCVSE